MYQSYIHYFKPMHDITIFIPGGKLCFFSPCIEQVQRTCAKMICKGFIELHTYECLQREMNVQYKTLPVLDLECLKYKVYFILLLVHNFLILII